MAADRVTLFLCSNVDDILFMHCSPGGARRNPRDWQAGMPPESVLIPGTMKRNRFVCIDAGKEKQTW